MKVYKYILIRSAIVLFSLFLGFGSMEAQLNFVELQPVDLGYKKLTKLSREENKPILAILYAEGYTRNTELALDPQQDLGFVKDSMITTIIDWSRQGNHKLVRRENVLTNPYFLILHHNGTVLLRSKGFSELSQFKDFVYQGQALFYRLESILTRYKSEKSEESLKDMIAFYTKVKDTERAEESIDELLDLQGNRMTVEDLQYLFEIGKQCLCSDNLNELFEQNKLTIQTFASAKEWLSYKQGWIINDLVKRDLLYPPNVWLIYESEFGEKADSLYRLFAISYFQKVEPDQEVLLDEVYEFLYYYKDAEWEVQDQLFLLALKITTEKEDFELLLDLISYHYFKNKNFRNMDFRAAILYKLGQEERALGMVQEIVALALEQGIRYSSILYELKK